MEQSVCVFFVRSLERPNFLFPHGIDGEKCLFVLPKMSLFVRFLLLKKESFDSISKNLEHVKNSDVCVIYDELRMTCWPNGPIDCRHQ